MNPIIDIVHLEDSTSPITDDTSIVRYMKLETLLLLLAERCVFIPSHANLANTDPLESKLFFELPDGWNIWEPRLIDLGPKMDLFLPAYMKQAGGSWGTISGPKSFALNEMRGSFRRYIDSLGTERCVWCWNRFRNYSHALWHLYGSRGVAITSTVGKVKAALLNSGVVRGIVAPITYVDNEGPHICDVLTKETTFHRPYLLKSVAFDYEEEIRFVLAARREILRDKRGVMVPIDSNFVTGFRASPHLQSEEQLAVKTLVEGFLNKRSESSRVPSLNSDWTAYYRQFEGKPFTATDSLPEVFLDMPPNDIATFAD